MASGAVSGARVDVTCGRALLHRTSYPLMDRLLGAAGPCLLEPAATWTSARAGRVVKVMDVKSLGSARRRGRVGQHRSTGFARSLKFVINDRADYYMPRTRSPGTRWIAGAPPSGSLRSTVGFTRKNCRIDPGRIVDRGVFSLQIHKHIVDREVGC